METNNSAPVGVRHPDVNYERRDLDHRTVILFLVALGVAGLLIHLIVWGAFEEWGKAQFVSHQTTNPIMTSNEQLEEIGGDPALTFPGPRIQPNPVADVNKFRIYEEDRLNSYGWVDPGAGKIRIPIERAIDILGTSWQQQQSLVAGQGTPPSPTGAQITRSGAAAKP